jgi:ParB/RepB/Spo0J family partition protein
LSVQPLLNFRRIRKINVDDIEPNPYNPRERISRKEVTDIRESIQEMGGILVPLVVYERNGKFVLLDGERRWRAAKELAKNDPKYQEVPANVVSGPLSKNDNFRTMFNIHMERKQWSTSAIAEAVGTLSKLNPKMTTKELSRITHAPPSAIREAITFLKMPEELRKRCLEGDLDEYYLIFLARNLTACYRAFPEIVAKYGWENLGRTFISKVDSGLIGRARDFNLISSMARKCINYDDKGLFAEVFERMVREKGFTPRDASRYVNIRLGYKVDDLFRSTCKDFLASLESYFETLQKGGIQSPRQTQEILLEILKALEKYAKPSEIAS